MGKLHLAENGAPTDLQNYIFVPKGFMGRAEDSYIREDVLDDIPDQEYYELMEVLGPISDNMLGGREERQARREARRERRRTRRAEKRANRERRKDYRMKRGERRQEAKERRIALRQEGRTTRAQVRQEGKSARTEARGKAYAPAISGMMQKMGQPEQRKFPFGFDATVTGGSSVWEQYKWPMIIGGTIAIGGLAYILTKK